MSWPESENESLSRNLHRQRFSSKTALRLSGSLETLKSRILEVYFVSVFHKFILCTFYSKINCFISYKVTFINFNKITTCALCRNQNLIVPLVPEFFYSYHCNARQDIFLAIRQNQEKNARLL